MKPLSIFEVKVAEKTAERLRHMAGAFSNVAWSLDEALRKLQTAQQDGPADPREIAQLTVQVFYEYQKAELFLAKHDVSTAQLLARRSGDVV